MSEQLRQYLKSSPLITFSSVDKQADMMVGTTARIVRSEQYRHFTPDQAKLIHRALVAHYKKLKSYLESEGEI